MRINKKLKLNKFKYVRIPSNAEYFGRFGTSLVGKPQYTGDETIPFAERKIDSIADGASLYEEFARQQDKQSE